MTRLVLATGTRAGCWSITDVTAAVPLCLSKPAFVMSLVAVRQHL